jgi:hypothetical protein
MANIALQVRPTLVGAVLLAVAVLPWRDHRRPPTVIGGPSPAFCPHKAAVGDVIPTPVHPDARPYPHGMVIAPPPIDDAINLWPSSPLDSLLSASIVPLLALRS